MEGGHDCETFNAVFVDYTSDKIYAHEYYTELNKPRVC